MQKITLTLLLLFLTISFNAQTVVWSSDLEDLTDWGINDLDGDGNNWDAYGPGNFDTVGFTGNVFASQSWATVPLTPDNLLYTPTFLLPAEAVTATFEMRVGASYTPDFAEHYAVYVYDNAVGPSLDDNILEETLTAGGTASAKIVTASIPVTFAGKTIGILIRHYDCTNNEYIVVDDFEVSYTTSLSTKDNTLEVARAYPNPVQDILKIDTNETIDSAEVINQLGQRVMDIKPNSIVKNTINLSTLGKGMYFIIIKSEERNATLKIMKV
ncbi:T9SS type A sorting domain-containing protein [Algibacter pectinivorans]|uniref:Por secretion system C-terminal sorting domain-containing protein n=1 Tax=Algibacter pectinivorans TaxID=870482 RepID=A0A1I1PW66_9FLAO|nr:T9SS type A sorting domain-containing protein [Algibacter pectinivorans]SFD11838.1 Por secretion system C-terminal sorting domain-containing protein [Algibacter pectinivorans]